MASLWNELERQLDDPTVAMRVGRAFPFGSYDVLDYVFATSRGVRTGLDNVLRYFRLLIDQAEMEVESNGSAIVRYRLYNDTAGLSRYSSEFTFSVVLDRLRGCADLDDWTPERVTFAHEARSDVSEYEAYFGCPVVFGAKLNEMILPSALLDAPMRRADPGLNNVLQRHAASLMETLPVAVSFDDSVRRELYLALTAGEHTPVVDDIAGRLAIGSRTLQRRLREADTSFATLLDELRFNLASRFLADPSMTIGEVGFLLGFSEPSAFNRAFRRWSGDTPGAYRRQAITELA